MELEYEKVKPVLKKVDLLKSLLFNNIERFPTELGA